MFYYSGTIHYGQNLPHFDKSNLMHFVTYRLCDSMPANVLRQIEMELKSCSPDSLDLQKRIKMEYWLDQGIGSCLLKKTECAEIVEKVWHHSDGQCFNIIAWVIMPNHVHILLKIGKVPPIEKIVQNWKKFSANKINKLLNRQGHVWQADYWDRAIRNKRHFIYTLEYIKKNINSGGVKWFFREDAFECYKMLNSEFEKES